MSRNATLRQAPILSKWQEPEPEETRLLVQLARDDVAPETLRWAAQRVVDDQLDEGFFRLLPALYPHFERQGVSHPGLPRIRGLYRLARARGLMITQAASNFADVMHSHGEPVLLLKGLALAHEYYHDLGTRPMHDADLMVPEQLNALRVEEILAAGGGWKREGSLVFQRAMKYRHPSGVALDLHRHLFDHSIRPQLSESLWARAQIMHLGDYRVLALSPEHQVFHAIIHGLPSNFVSPFRWIVDVGRVLNQRDVSWAMVVDTAVEYRLTSMLATGLNWLARNGLSPRITVPAADNPVDLALQRGLVKPHSARERANQRGRSSRMITWHWHLPRRLLSLRGQTWSAAAHAEVVRSRWGPEETVKGKALGVAKRSLLASRP